MGNVLKKNYLNVQKTFKMFRKRIQMLKRKTKEGQQSDKISNKNQDNVTLDRYVSHSSIVFFLKYTKNSLQSE